MLDPKTAVALASAIVQFVDFSSKVLKKTVEIYKDEATSDSARADLDAEIVTPNLVLVKRQLGPRDHVEGPLRENEAALFELRESCEKLGNELIDNFRRIHEAGQAGRGRKIKKRGKACGMPSSVSGTTKRSTK